MKKVNVRITGRVQGVSYRAWTRATAEQMGLTGWVRNEPDGSVFALLCGSDENVAVMIETLWSGPPAAIVDNVEVSEAEAADEARGFKITR
ncbi:acylphosphatase [Hoeflea sp. WL0058]|uniref:acylphosphatase n=1 Tax=Flavimaribacter sediminis TaxID=2865987 RepID=A0AAE2ZG69_9HYPH|nr:acylphosphatase [Flavimaribacter sediminis]MBW8635944.1 acylphosphatase [Flavimaribacter sediminis]